MSENNQPKKLSEADYQIPINKAFKFEPQQRILHHKLKEKTPILADMYLGALQALSEDNNPDKFALVAHGFRELMEKIPFYVNIQIRPSVSIKVKVNELKTTWGKAKTSCCWKNDVWNGVIDKKLQKLLKAIDSFFKWHDGNMSNRSDQIIRVFRGLDPSKRSVPHKLEKINADWWLAINEYYQGVAHHTKKTNYDEFYQYVIELEKFLIDRISPRTFEDHSEIDSILGGS